MENFTITADLLLENGYKRFHDQFKDGEIYKGSFQKRFKDEEGIKYHINFHEFCPHHLMPAMTIPNYKFSASVQFNDAQGDTFDVDFFVRANRHLISDVEQFFENIFVNMNCSYEEIC